MIKFKIFSSNFPFQFESLSLSLSSSIENSSFARFARNSLFGRPLASSRENGEEKREGGIGKGRKAKENEKERRGGKDREW